MNIKWELFDRNNLKYPWGTIARTSTRTYVRSSFGWKNEHGVTFSCPNNEITHVLIPRFRKGEIVLAGDCLSEIENTGVRTKFVSVAPDGQFLTTNYNKKLKQFKLSSWKYCVELPEAE